MSLSRFVPFFANHDATWRLALKGSLGLSTSSMQCASTPRIVDTFKWLLLVEEAGNGVQANGRQAVVIIGAVVMLGKCILAFSSEATRWASAACKIQSTDTDEMCRRKPSVGADGRESTVCGCVRLKANAGPRSSERAWRTSDAPRSMRPHPASKLARKFRRATPGTTPSCRTASKTS